MNTLIPVVSALVLSLGAAPATAADITAGKQKAATCALCHGDQSFGGIFYTLQLAGRNADKLVIKTNKYRSGKILHPIMNLVTVGLSDQDVTNIAAYYQSLGKPAFTSPLFHIKTDDDPDTHAESGFMGNVATVR